jgi:transposase
LDKESVVRVCIDDFALKKRFRYGTIMVNIDTRRVIDLFESRDPDEVAKWLVTYPNIQVVSRDGSAGYATAIRKAHPTAVQVSDRFHLIKNLSECAKQHITKIMRPAIRIPTTGTGCTPVYSDGYWEYQKEFKEDLPGKLHEASTGKKMAVVEKARELAREGMTVTEIAKEVGISSPTARKYIDESFVPCNPQFGELRYSKLKPYTNTIDGMLRERQKFKDIEIAIRNEGYTGAASTIRMYATRQRRIIAAANAEKIANTELVERRWITKLLYQPIDKIRGITEKQAEQVIAEFPVVGQLYDAVRSFKELMFTKHVDELDDWIAAAKSLGIDEIDGFVNGISQDIEAVKNSIRYDYNNGLAEWSVNKLKLIKKIMFGRCSFATLRKKLLGLEEKRIFK